jgi:hypothetical protein
VWNVGCHQHHPALTQSEGIATHLDRDFSLQRQAKQKIVGRSALGDIARAHGRQ